MKESRDNTRLSLPLDIDPQLQLDEHGCNMHSMPSSCISTTKSDAKENLCILLGS